jgi:hypothetical protein
MLLLSAKELPIFPRVKKICDLVRFVWHRTLYAYDAGEGPGCANKHGKIIASVFVNCAGLIIL